MVLLLEGLERRINDAVLRRRRRRRRS